MKVKNLLYNSTMIVNGSDTKIKNINLFIITKPTFKQITPEDY